MGCRSQHTAALWHWRKNVILHCHSTTSQTAWFIQTIHTKWL